MCPTFQASPSGGRSWRRARSVVVAQNSVHQSTLTSMKGAVRVPEVMRTGFRALARTRPASLRPPRERATRPLLSLLPLVAFAFFAAFATFHNREISRGRPCPEAQESSGFRISLQRLRRARELPNRPGRGVERARNARRVEPGANARWAGEHRGDDVTSPGWPRSLRSESVSAW